MIIVRCKDCNKELRSNNKTQVCGCPNMMTVTGDKVSAVDLNKVVMINSSKKEQKSNVLSNNDLAYQEARRQRKVRKLDFEIKVTSFDVGYLDKFEIRTYHNILPEEERLVLRHKGGLNLKKISGAPDYKLTQIFIYYLKNLIILSIR